jgi:hypothetical protein
MCDRGSNSRPPDFDTMMEDPLLPIRLYKPSDIEGAREPFIKFQQDHLFLTQQGKHEPPFFLFPIHYQASSNELTIRVINSELT